MRLSDKRLVAVIWGDAHGDATGGYGEADLDTFHQPMVYTSFGLLLRDDAVGVCIASEWCGDEWRGMSFVPRAMIREVHDLGIPQTRRKKARDKSSAVVGSANGGG